MNNKSSKFEILYEVVERNDAPGVWSVEGIDDDGGIFLTLFHGPMSKLRADTYAAILNAANP